ncbi:hypothetical protein [Nonomuraea sp. NPDC046570]|uniref:hypothetical protein n=1 Tax=Nonomuraea sp. NPDC046570 TaxID=3155255 RepID=UPI0033E91E3F
MTVDLLAKDARSAGRACLRSSAARAPWNARPAPDSVYCKYDGNIRNAPYTSGRTKGRVVAQCKPDQWLPATCYVYGDSSNGTSLWYAWNKSGGKWFINASQVYTRGAGSLAKC